MRGVRLILLSLLVFGCATDRVAGPNAGAAGDPAFGSANAATDLVVMTRNMYVGAPVEPILAAPPESIPFRVAEAWAVVTATDAATRARAMAAEIKRARPHLVGLQEVSLFRTQFPSDIVTGTLAPNATDVAYDFLALLLDALSAEGLTYVVGAIIENTDVEVPRFDGIHPSGVPLFTDVRLTDYDAILVRGDVPWSDAAAGNYSVSLPAPAGIDVLRGWTAVTALVDGMAVRFVNTHLEAEAEIVRYYQAAELMTLLAGESGPVVLVGDLNTGPGRPLADGGQATYDFILAQGFMDAWSDKKPATQDGFTCCHAGDLSNRRPMLRQRIDLVLTRGAMLPAATMHLAGDTPGDRARWGVWPSDHAGVTARWVLPSVMAAH